MMPSTHKVGMPADKQFVAHCYVLEMQAKQRHLAWWHACGMIGGPTRGRVALRIIAMTIAMRCL